MARSVHDLVSIAPEGWYRPLSFRTCADKLDLMGGLWQSEQVSSWYLPRYLVGSREPLRLGSSALSTSRMLVRCRWFIRAISLFV